MELTLTETRRETPDVKSFKFDLSGMKFDFKPGQHIMMKLDVVDERRGIRAFSIASSPTENFLLISTKITDSNFKRKLDSLKVGGKVEINGPFGRFLLYEDYSKNAVMLGGGIGITPFRNMIKFATDNKLDLKIVLIYSNKTPEDIVYRKELEKWEKINPNLKIVNTITKPEESKEKWNGLIGRIDDKMIKKYADIDNSIFYICGPPTMVDGLLQLLKSMNVDESKIKIERFTGY